MKQDYWVGVGVSAVLWTRTLGFYAIHKPTRRNPKEKHIIPQEDCEWNENPFPYISETYGTKNYIYEKFFTPAARLLFYLIVYIIWRGTQVAIRGGPAKTVGRETGARVRIPPSPPKVEKYNLLRDI